MKKKLIITISNKSPTLLLDFVVDFTANTSYLQ